MTPALENATLTMAVLPGSYWRVSAEEDDSLFLTPEGLARQIRESHSERTPFLIVIPPVTDGKSDTVTFDMRAKDSIANYRVADLVSGWRSYYPHSVVTRLVHIAKRPTTQEAQAGVASQQTAEAGKPSWLDQLRDALEQAGKNATQTALMGLLIVGLVIAVGYAVYKRID